MAFHKPNYIVLICVGRTYGRVGLMRKVIQRLHAKHGDALMILHGGAKGADTLAGFAANEKGIPVVVVPANWDKFDRAAGPVRNAWMLRLRPKQVIAFPGGVGTADMIKQAIAAGIKVTQRTQ